MITLYTYSILLMNTQGYHNNEIHQKNKWYKISVIMWVLYFFKTESILCTKPLQGQCFAWDKDENPGV